MCACVDQMNDKQLAQVKVWGPDFAETASELEDAFAGFPLEDFLAKIGVKETPCTWLENAAKEAPLMQ